MSKLLIIFIKNPIEGKVKTRLASALGKQEALHIYQKLLQHTFSVSNNLKVNKTVFYSDFIPHNDVWKENEYQQKLQHGNDLGERMLHAFDFAFINRYKNAVIIGSDCYELTTEVLEQAFIQLKDNDAVIGPAKDGGYYLLGIKQQHKELFENITWSAASALNETLTVCDKKKLKYYLLPLMNDIDNEEDWVMHERKHRNE